MAATAVAATVLVRDVVTPRWRPFTMARPGLDGLLRRRGDARQRLLHHPGSGAAVVVAARLQPDGRVAFAARAADEATAAWGIGRLRFALGVDDDLAPFHAAFVRDPLIGAAVRALPGERMLRRPLAFEALAWAVTEQLIELERATAIQRRLVATLGRRCATTGLRDAPTAAALAGAAPAEIAAADLAPARALVLRRAAAEVAAGRVPALHPGDGPRGAGHDGLRRLRAIPGIGTWTLDCLALFGLGRLDVVPAGDLGYLKLVGRLVTGRPKSIADEAEVRGVLAPYEPWAGLAGHFLMIAAARGALTAPRPRTPAPRAGTRSSAGTTRRPAA